MEWSDLLKKWNCHFKWWLEYEEVGIWVEFCVESPTVYIGFKKINRVFRLPAIFALLKASELAKEIKIESILICSDSKFLLLAIASNTTYWFVRRAGRLLLNRKSRITFIWLPGLTVIFYEFPKSKSLLYVKTMYTKFWKEKNGNKLSATSNQVLKQKSVLLYPNMYDHNKFAYEHNEYYALDS